MPSFDIVSDVDLQEVDNAVNQTAKEISQRFDFRGSKATLEFSKSDRQIRLQAEDDLKLRAIRTLLEQKLIKRDVDIRAVKFGDEKPVGGQMLKQVADLQVGLDKDNAKVITKAIKDTKLKVQAEIQQEQVRVTAKKIDDLQAVIGHLKGMSLEFPIQFINMRK